jgi:hypothetical protein
VEALSPYLRHQRVLATASSHAAVSHKSRVVLAKIVLLHLSISRYLDHGEHVHKTRNMIETAIAEQESSEISAANSEHRRSPLLCSPSTSVPPYSKETRFALICVRQGELYTILPELLIIWHRQCEGT